MEIFGFPKNRTFLAVFFKNKVLFINGVKEVTRERAYSFLSDNNLEKLVDAYLNLSTLYLDMDLKAFYLVSDGLFLPG